MNNLYAIEVISSLEEFDLVKYELPPYS